ncbi:MAG: RNA degradosome polyphosphate kinase [Tumebacillaceae bacterium]
MGQFDRSSYYINRELSWLSFNERVLAEAADESNPLFEQLKFVAIASSNLDEFFMVRVAGLKDDVREGIKKPDSKTHMTPKQQLHAITDRVHGMMNRMYEILNEELFPALASNGVRFLQPQELNEEQLAFLKDYFHHFVFPVLTPMAVDASRPFPMLANKSLNLAVLLDKQLYSVVQVPSVLPRVIELPSEGEERDDYILLEDVIRQHMDTLFQGNRIVEVSPFRITRDSGIHIDEVDVEDLLIEIQKELKKRKMGAAVRLEVADSMSKELRAMLQNSLHLRKEDVHLIHGPLDLTFFMKFYSLPGYEMLKFDELEPQQPRDLIGEKGIFDAIADRDIMLLHPFESFEPVVHFVHQAAEDPNVLAIKQTLYRVSGNSPIVQALIRAAENGKQVTVLLELKARFDEENNITWAKRLEKAGCHVIYGLVGLKTHSKITLVVRQEEGQLRRYVHLGTGNYNDISAKFYTDIGMFTAREDFGFDATAFFNHLTGYMKTPEWKRIVTAPNGMKEKFVELIDNEIKKSTPDNPGRILAKMNSLTDMVIMQKLFEASCAGVQVDLVVRGVCCLRPGIPGVSENIRVFSIVGRFLEHTRVYYFKNGGDEQIYLASADWMTRNMESRVEILFPVVQENLKERVKHVLQTKFSDNVKRYELHANGEYEKLRPQGGEEPVESQLALHREAEEAARLKELDTYFYQLKPKTHREELV